MKTAESILNKTLEKINLVTTDDIDSKLIAAMEEYANHYKWISVRDELPICLETGNWDGTRSDFVLAIDKNEMQIVARCYNGFIDGNYFTEWVNQDDYTIEFITHWQPLPEPPKH